MNEDKWLIILLILLLLINRIVFGFLISGKIEIFTGIAFSFLQENNLLPGIFDFSVSAFKAFFGNKIKL